ncbi:MAG: hypothetical protein JSV56_01215, partial [Methanomassiliicoccales archaeon]
TVDMFSGRPNPSFEITDPKEIVHLRNGLKDLKEVVIITGEEIREFGRLGYRGILITNSAGINGIPSRVQFLNGKVRVFSEEGNKDKFLKDVAAGMEKYYLGLAKKRGLIPKDLMDKGIVPDPDTM